MKHKTVSTIAAILCGGLLFFAASLTAFAQNGVRTAELELNPPADAENAGRFRFSFETGKTEWIPIRRITSLQDLAEVSAQQNQEKATAELDFSMMGEIDMRKAEIMVLSESEIKSILSTGKLPEKDATKKPQRMKPDSWYILKDETDQSFYVFKLKDHSPKYAWLEIAYVRIPDGTSWKKNPDLTALLDVPKADAASNSRRKTNAEKTRQKILQAWDKQEAERKQAEKQAEQDALNKRIESVKSSGDTFPKTPEEIKLVEDLIMSAKYEELLKLCEGKKLDFNVKSTRGDNMSLLSLALYHNSRNLNQSRLDRKNMIFEFVLNNGGAPVIFTEEGMDCVFFAARTNNKKAFDLLLKNGFDPNRKGPNGKTVLEFLVERNIKVDPEIMNKLKATTKPSLFSMVLESNADGLKKALEDKENLAAINKPIPPLDGSVAGQTLLEHALAPRKSPHRETVKTLLDAGATFKAGDIGGLMLHQHEYILPLFWEHRDRMSEGDWEKCFTMSAAYRNADAFKFFLEKGFDPEKVSSVIFSEGPLEMVEILEAQGIKKPFWAAVKWNDLELVKEYLAAGADVNAEDNTTHHPPIYNAVENNLLEMAELLIKNGANPSPKGYREWEYPMEAVATIKNGAKMTELLLKNGFVPDYPKTPGDTKHPNGSSALYCALFKKNYDTARVLLKYGARTDLTEETEIYDRKQGKRVKVDAGLEELFKNDPEALKVLGEKKNFFDSDDPASGE